MSKFLEDDNNRKVVGALIILEAVLEQNRSNPFLMGSAVESVVGRIYEHIVGEKFLNGYGTPAPTTLKPLSESEELNFLMTETLLDAEGGKLLINTSLDLIEHFWNAGKISFPDTFKADAEEALLFVKGYVSIYNFSDPLD